MAAPRAKKTERAPRSGPNATKGAHRANRQRRGAKTTSPKGLTDAELLERRAKAFELRKRGYSYAQIAAAHAVSVSVAWSDVKAVYDQLLPIEEVEEMRRMELARLDVLSTRIEEQVHAGNLFAIDRALKIMERRARLAGLDAPVRSEVKVEAVTRDDIERELAAFMAGHDSGRADGVREASGRDAGKAGSELPAP